MPTLSPTRLERGQSFIQHADKSVPAGKPLESSVLAKVGIATSIWPTRMLQALLRFNFVERHFVDIGKEVIHQANCSRVASIFGKSLSTREADSYLSRDQINGLAVLGESGIEPLSKQVLEESKLLRQVRQHRADLHDMVGSLKDLDPEVKKILHVQIDTIASLTHETVQNPKFLSSPECQWLDFFGDLLNDTGHTTEEILQKNAELFKPAFHKLRPEGCHEGLWNALERDFPRAWTEGLSLTALQENIERVMAQATATLAHTTQEPTAVAQAALRVITDPALDSAQQFAAAGQLQEAGGDWQKAELKVLLLANGAPPKLEEAVLQKSSEIPIECQLYAEPKAQAKLQELIKLHTSAVKEHHIPEEKATAVFIAMLPNAHSLESVEQAFADELLAAGARPQNGSVEKRWKLELREFSTPGLRTKGRIKDEGQREAMVSAFLKEFGYAKEFKRPSSATELLWAANQLFNEAEGRLSPEEIMAGCRSYVQDLQTTEGLAALSTLPKIKGKDSTVEAIAKKAFPAVLNNLAVNWDETHLSKAGIVSFFQEQITLDKGAILTSEHGRGALQDLFEFTQTRLAEGADWTVLSLQMEQAFKSADLTSLDKFNEIFSRMERERKVEQVKVETAKAQPEINIGKALQTLKQDPAKVICAFLRPIISHYVQEPAKRDAILKKLNDKYLPQLREKLEGNEEAKEWIAAQLQAALPPQIIAAARILKLKSADAIQINIASSLDEIEASLKGEPAVWGQEVTGGLHDGFLSTMSEAKTEIEKTSRDPKNHPKQFLPALASLLFDEIPNLILGKSFGGRFAGWLVGKVGMERIAKMAGSGLLSRFEGLIRKGMKSQRKKYERELAQRKEEKQTPQVQERIKSLERNIAMVKLMRQPGMLPLLAEMTDSFLPQLVSEHKLEAHIPLLELMYHESHADPDQELNTEALTAKLDESAALLIEESKAHLPWLNQLVPAFLSLGKE